MRWIKKRTRHTPISSKRFQHDSQQRVCLQSCEHQVLSVSRKYSCELLGRLQLRDIVVTQGVVVLGDTGGRFIVGIARNTNVARDVGIVEAYDFRDADD